MSDVSEQTRWMDATEQAQLVAEGEVKPIELVDAAIARIEAGDGALNAVVLRWFEDARAAAAEVRPGEAPLAGVPTLVKDLWAHVEGQPLTNGNAGLAADPPRSGFDSTIVRRLRQAGSVLLGRSASAELGTLPVTETLAYGATRNPWDTERTPGGSSGGAAAAVAAGFVPFAHGSDGGGSVRIPAGCCGLVGLKPSRGRVPMGPDRLESGLGIDFVLTRSVRDTAVLLDAIAVPGVGDEVIAPPPVRPYAAEVGVDPGRLRVGILDHRPDGQPVDEACRAATVAAGELLESLGHDVELGFPPALADPSFTARFASLWTVSRAAGLATCEAQLGRPLTEDEVEPLDWVLARMADGTTALDYAAALGAVGELRRAVQQWWADGFDLLLTPTMAEPPLRIGALDAPPEEALRTLIGAGEWVPFTPPFNASGQPGISLPLGWTDDGLPVGVQLVAGYAREDVLIRVAAQLEAAQPWIDRHPAS